MAEIFRRIEKKYILNKEQYNKLIPELKKYMEEDRHGKSTICNIYFDTEQYELIRHSITKPYYKEKVRLRSYNVPTEESKVYLEIKRKCDGVVGKRRIAMQLSEFQQYMKDQESLNSTNPQIKSELDYYFQRYFQLYYFDYYFDFDLDSFLLRLLLLVFFLLHYFLELHY